MPYTDESGSWLQMSLATNPPDNNILTLGAPENHGPTRTATVHVGTRTVTVTQDGNAMDVASVSPAAGPMSGGTPVIIQGFGFVPGMTVYFGGIGAPATLIDQGTLIAITPAIPRAGPSR